MEFLGIVLNIKTARVHLLLEKIRSSQCRVALLQDCSPRSIHFCMGILGKMVSTIKTIPYAWFHSHSLQQSTLACRNRSLYSLDSNFLLPPLVCSDLTWWMVSPVILQGKSFLPLNLLVILMDDSPFPLGSSFRVPQVQGRCSKKETLLQINLLELRAIFLSLSHWTSFARSSG